MSKRNLRGVLLLASALSLGVLGTVVSCNQKTENPGPVENDPWKDFVVDNTIASLTITNKDAIEAEWWVGEDDRTLELNLGKEYNLASLIYENKIMAVSSNPDVATVTGLKIQAVAEGTATIEVRAGEHKATVALTIQQDHLEVGGEYSLEQIVSIPNTNKKWFKSSAVITGWVKGTDGQQYGNLYVAKDWSKGATSYQVYGATGKTATEGGSYVDSSNNTVTVDKVLSEKDGVFTFNNPRDWLTNANTKDLKVGDKISFDCIRCDYNGVIELSLWNVKYVEHKEFETAPEPDPVQFTSLEQVLAGTKEENKAKKFVGKAKIKAIKPNDKYGNLWFEVPESIAADYKDGLIVYGSTATTTAITWDGVNEQYTFNNPKDYLTNDLTKNLVVGQEIDVELIRADFTKDDVVTKEVCAVIKSAKQVVPTEIKISGESKVALNENITLTATTNPAQISVPLTWESSNAEVAKVSEEGVVTGLSVGKALITAKYGTVVSNSIEVEVTNIIAPTSITIEGASKIKVSETTTYTISAIEPSDYNVELTWSSSNTEVATIDNSGVVTGVSAGTTEITVSYGEVVSNAITLTVEAKNSSTLNTTNLGLTVSYTNSGANVTIEGLTVAWTQLYKGSNGIQFRVKNGVNSAIYNAEASTKSIKNIVINWNAEKNTKDNTEFMHMYFGNDTSVGSETINVDKKSGVNTVTITPSASTYTFFKLEHRASKNSAYIDSIEIVYVD